MSRFAQLLEQVSRAGFGYQSRRIYNGFVFHLWKGEEEFHCCAFGHTAEAAVENALRAYRDNQTDSAYPDELAVGPWEQMASV